MSLSANLKLIKKVKIFCYNTVPTAKLTIRTKATGRRVQFEAETCDCRPPPALCLSPDASMVPTLCLFPDPSIIPATARPPHLISNPRPHYGLCLMSIAHTPVSGLRRHVPHFMSKPRPQYGPRLMSMPRPQYWSRLMSMPRPQYGDRLMSMPRPQYGSRLIYMPRLQYTLK